jgi:hypothetical protein
MSGSTSTLGRIFPPSPLSHGGAGRASPTSGRRGSGASGMEATTARRPGLRWADLLRRLYDIDRRTCPNCGLGTLEPIATIVDLDAIGRRSRALPP